MKQLVTISLEPSTKKEVQKILELRGQKLSPVIEILLKKFVEENQNG